MKYINDIAIVKQALKEENEAVVLDIETTSFMPGKGGMIIEIGAVKIINGRIIDTFQQLIYPECKISGKITELTGITNEMAEDMPVIKEVLPRFLDFIGDALIVGHNVNFDWDRFLIYFFEKIGRKPSNPVVDTEFIAKQILPKQKSYKLSAVAKTLEVDKMEYRGEYLSSNHRALNDSLITSMCFLKLKELLDEFDTSEGMVDGQVSIFGVVNKEVYVRPEKEVLCTDYKITNIAYWEKSVTKSNLMQRIYVSTNIGVAYFDIPTRVWGMDKLQKPVDIRELSKNVVNRLINNPAIHNNVINDIKTKTTLEIEELIISY